MPFHAYYHVKSRCTQKYYLTNITHYWPNDCGVWSDLKMNSLSKCLFLSALNRIQQLFMELLSNSRQLRWLSCSFMLGLVTPCSLTCLSNPSAETLQHLSLLDHQLGAYMSGNLHVWIVEYNRDECWKTLTKLALIISSDNVSLFFFLINSFQVPSSHHQSWIVFLTFILWLWISLTSRLSFAVCWHLHAELHCIVSPCCSAVPPWSSSH